MGYFVDEASHKVEGRLRRGITITFTGLSLVLSRADIFVRLQNRLGSQTFLILFICTSMDETAVPTSIFFC